MPAFRRFFLRLRALVRPDRAEHDLSREITAHLQLLEDDFAARGMSRDDARAAARRAFGGVEQAKEAQRDARGFRMLAGWPTDLKLGVRMLRRTPGLTVIGIIALAVAIGGGAAYFEFYADFFHPTLRVAEANRLVGVQVLDLEENEADRRVAHVFGAMRDSLTRADAVGAWHEFDQNLFTADGRTDPVRGVAVSASAFAIMQTPPLAGRTLQPADEQPGAPAVAVLSHAVWTQRFNGDPSVVGSIARLGNDPIEIVGVMPEGFAFPVNHEFWTPLQLDTAAMTPGAGPSLGMFARLADDADVADLQGELDVLMASVEADLPPDLRGRRRAVAAPYVRSLWNDDDGGAERLGLFMANLFFVALLGLCAANVATLVFGRTVTRESELTVRASLGASRGRLVAQLIAEALVLASVAAVIGLAIAAYVLGWVRIAWERAQGVSLPFWWDGRLGIDTILYTAALVVFAALIIGGIPALKATGPALQARLKFAAAGSTMRFGWVWTTIIVMQVAITVMFLLGGIAFAWSINRIERQYREVAFARADYRAARFVPLPADTEPQQGALAWQRLSGVLQRLEADSAAEAITYTTHLPGIDQGQTWVDVDGRLLPVRGTQVGPDYFTTFGLPLRQGRAFSASETGADRNVAIVDEAFVRYVLGGRAAVGQQIRLAGRDPDGELGEPIEIIGVVGDMSTAPDRSLKDATLYRPVGAALPRAVDIVVRANPAHRVSGLPALGETFRDVAGSVPEGARFYDMGAMDAGGEGDVVEYVYTAMAVIGAVAVLLSTAGIYALVSFTLARRTREIGLRAALGATPGRIVSGVLRRSLTQIGAGVLIGAVPGAIMVSEVANFTTGRNELPLGAMVAAGVALFVLSVAALSCAGPLKRALSLQPTEALRVE